MHRRLLGAAGALCLAATPAGAAMVYDVGFSTPDYAGDISFDRSTDRILAVNFAQDGRVWTVGDLILSSAYEPNGTYYTVDGSPNGTGIAIFPPATTVAQNDFKLTFHLLFANGVASALGNRLDTQSVGYGYRTGPVAAGLVPEPASWALFIVGMGVAGASLRRRPRRPPRTA